MFGKAMSRRVVGVLSASLVVSTSSWVAAPSAHASNGVTSAMIQGWAAYYGVPAVVKDTQQDIAIACNLTASTNGPHGCVDPSSSSPRVIYIWNDQTWTSAMIQDDVRHEAAHWYIIDQCGTPSPSVANYSLGDPVGTPMYELVTDAYAWQYNGMDLAHAWYHRRAGITADNWSSAQSIAQGINRGDCGSVFTGWGPAISPQPLNLTAAQIQFQAMSWREPARPTSGGTGTTPRGTST